MPSLSSSRSHDFHPESPRECALSAHQHTVFDVGPALFEIFDCNVNIGCANGGVTKVNLLQRPTSSCRITFRILPQFHQQNLLHKFSDNKTEKRADAPSRKAIASGVAPSKLSWSSSSTSRMGTAFKRPNKRTRTTPQTRKEKRMVIVLCREVATAVAKYLLYSCKISSSIISRRICHNSCNESHGRPRQSERSTVSLFPCITDTPCSIMHTAICFQQYWLQPCHQLRK